MTDLPEQWMTGFCDRDGGFWSHVVGVTFDDRQNFITDDLRDIGLSLEPDPTNPHDVNAIKVVRNDNRQQVGFIKKEHAESLARLFQQGYKPVIDTVVPTGGTPEKRLRGLNIRLACEGIDLGKFVFGGGSQTHLFDLGRDGDTA